jgi:DNA repair protein RadC
MSRITSVEGQEVVSSKSVSTRRVPINKWPESARPREKLRDQGPRALSDAELLAILLRSGTRGHSAIDLAHTYIAEFGSLRELLAADWNAWIEKSRKKKTEKNAKRKAQKKGMGLARYAALQAALELTRRHLLEPAKVGSVLSAPDAVQRFLMAQLRDRPYEVFCVLFLNSRHRLIAFEELFRGTTDAAQVYTREILHRVLARNAPSIILAHNHPSGDIEPSEADEAITRRIKEALGLVDVRVLDHIIIGDGRCFSFSEHGML